LPGFGKLVHPLQWPPRRGLYPERVDAATPLVLAGQKYNVRRGEIQSWKRFVVIVIVILRGIL
jgi:hypothetical protein